MLEQASDRIWLVTFMDYDLGYFDDETCRLEPLAIPFGPKVLFYVSGAKRNPSVRNGPTSYGSRSWIRTSDHSINSRMLYR
jgi:hypothetical protein